MSVNGDLIVLSFNPSDGSYDRDTLRNYLSVNARALIRGSVIGHFPFYVAETNDEADEALKKFREAKTGKKPVKKRPKTIAELLSDKK